MLSLPLPVKVFWCLAATDMRKSFDGLAAGDGQSVELSAEELALILSGIDLAGAKRQKRYQRKSA